jgi:hypothetical protein
VQRNQNSCALTVSVSDILKRPGGWIDFVCKILASWGQGAEGIPVRSSRRRQHCQREAKQLALFDSAMRPDTASKKGLDTLRRRTLSLVLLVFYCALVWAIILVIAHEALLHAPDIALIAPKSD